jgi:tetratricopeptide (TPR) repeat protein
MDRDLAFHQWIRQLRKEMPIAEIIGRVQLRLQNADADDKDALVFELKGLFTEAGRYDEALRLIDTMIERKPHDVRYPISKAMLHYYYLEDLEPALKSIDFALERAFRTRFFRREALNAKARILLDLGRGDALGEVLEQIMSLDMYSEFPDIQRERDFVDRAPSGLIRGDIVARYDKFCPKRDPSLELHRWARQLESKASEGEVIDLVRSRLQSASAEEQLTLTYILGMLLSEAKRSDEAMPLFDSVIKLQPDNVRCVIAKATLYYRDAPEKALKIIDLALERALRTGFYRRKALGEKARILLKLGRGEELGQVLEHIMLLEMFSDVRDIGRERDFVDRAPPGVIAEDIVVRYNEFCPTLDGH